MSQADRIALSEYFITGQVPLAGGGALVGSPVMFGAPSHEAQRSLDESFLQVGAL